MRRSSQLRRGSPMASRFALDHLALHREHGNVPEANAGERSAEAKRRESSRLDGGWGNRRRWNWNQGDLARVVGLKDRGELFDPVRKYGRHVLDRVGTIDLNRVVSGMKWVIDRLLRVRRFTIVLDGVHEPAHLRSVRRFARRISTGSEVGAKRDAADRPHVARAKSITSALVRRTRPYGLSSPMNLFGQVSLGLSSTVAAMKTGCPTCTLSAA